MEEIKAQFEMDMEEPSEELMEIAKRELGEDPDKRCQIIAELRDMIYERGECIPHRTDDAFLLRFLRARNFIVRRAHRLFVNYHTFKEEEPDFFENVKFDTIKAIGDDSIISTLPFKEASGRRLIFYRMGRWNPNKFTVTELFQASLVALEIGILEPSTQILGGVCVFDMGELSTNQIYHMTPRVAAKFIQIALTSFPLRTHAIHVINQSKVCDIVFSVFKPFLTEEMRQRVFFHGSNLEALHKHVSPKYLPKEYGGIHPYYSYGKWLEFFRNNDTVVKELNLLGYDLEAQLDSNLDYSQM